MAASLELMHLLAMIVMPYGKGTTGDLNLGLKPLRLSRGLTPTKARLDRFQAHGS